MDKSKIICRRSCLMIIFFCHITLKTKASFSSDIQPVPYSKGFTTLFGEVNVKPSIDYSSVNLYLDQYTGAGFKSFDFYSHGFYSALIKLPSNYTAGVVVAFYTTNGDVFEKTHDELDFEFLGHIGGKPWTFQTNMYGNGSTRRGREERYYLWFDPSEEFHRYSILWTTNNILYFIDDIPIREITRNDAMRGDYPSKPMALYATIWDGSDWATSGGQYKVNYDYAPFIAEFTALAFQGCVIDPVQEVSDCTEKDNQLESASFAKITPEQRAAMKQFRQTYMYYSYCYDSSRYAIPLPECVIDSFERRTARGV